MYGDMGWMRAACWPRHPNVLALTLLLSAVRFLCGITATEVNVPELEFIRWLSMTFGGKKLSHTTLIGIWSSILASRSGAQMLASFFIPSMTDKLGRKNSFLIFCAFLAAGDLFCSYGIYSSQEHWTFLTGRLCSGVAEAGTLSVGLLWILETSTQRYRGAHSIVPVIFKDAGLALGIWLGKPTILGTLDKLPMLFCIVPVATSLCAVLLMIFPDSPRHLYQKQGNSPELTHSLQFYCAKDASLEYNKIMDEVTQCDESQTPKDTPQDDSPPGLTPRTKKKHYWLELTLTAAYGICLTSSGKQVLFSYSEHLMLRTGVSEEASYHYTLLTHIVPILACLLTMYFVEKVGRRPLLFAYGWLNVACEMILSVGLAWIGRNIITEQWGQSSPIQTVPPPSAQSKTLSLFLAIIIIVWSAAATGGVNSLMFITGELLPQELRTVGVTVASVSASVTSIVDLQFFEVIESHKPGVGFLLLVFPLMVSLTFLSLKLPETKRGTKASKKENLLLEDMDTEEEKDGKASDDTETPPADPTSTPLLGIHLDQGLLK